MFYTSIVLFSGFFIFLASDFGGTQALGLLVSITLVFAMFSNLILLPSLLISLDKVMTGSEMENILIDLAEDE
jgi:predicted RND superfamily exporter protein